jgi:enoyl-CoA hydratase/carnithine racemase
MKVEFTVEEIHAMFQEVVDQIVALDLDKKDRAAIRRWAAADMKPGEVLMRRLSDKINEQVQQAGLGRVSRIADTMADVDAPFVRIAREGDVVWLTLNRPERLNAVSLEMRDDLWSALTLLRDDPTVRCAVLHGAGERAFSAGADITEFGTAAAILDAREARRARDLWGVMSTLPVPLIAALHGFAYGAGLEMSLYCDIRIAADDARFALPEVTLGYIPSAGGTQTAPRQLRRSDALRLVTTGEPMTAAEAFDAGLVHAVVPRSVLLETARAWAERIATRPPEATRAAKRAILEGADLPLADGLAFERRLVATLRGGA